MTTKQIIFNIWIICASLMAATAQSEQVQYTYDRAGRLTGVYSDSGNSVTYVHDAAGNLLRRKTTVISDSDGDFMDDAFETSFFTNLVRNGTGDFDGDGQSDLAEFFAGTNPADAASLLSVTTTSKEPAGMVISWAAVNGKRYRVQYKEGLVAPAWHDLAGDVTAVGNSASKTDAGALSRPMRFYRIILLQ
jgi:YD repeat-containing protein